MKIYFSQGKSFLLRNLGPASPHLSQNSERILLVCLHCHQFTLRNVACATSRALYPRMALDCLAINTVEEVPDQLVLTGSVLTHLRASSMRPLPSIHLFNNYLLIICYVPGITLGTQGGATFLTRWSSQQLCLFLHHLGISMFSYFTLMPTIGLN